LEDISTKNLKSLQHHSLREYFGEFTILLSTMIDEELEFAPERIKTLFSKLDDSFTEFLKDTDEAVDLASQYIEEKVVG
jgi:hypothetical protein